MPPALPTTSRSQCAPKISLLLCGRSTLNANNPARDYATLKPMESGKTIALSRSQRAPVLIVGAHRSGTTATARALQLLGLQIGQDLDSHHEPRGMQRLHEEYLRGLGASWFDPTAFLKWVRTPEGESLALDY